MQAVPNNPPAPLAAPSQHNPGATRAAITDARRRAAFLLLSEYYKAVEQGRAPID